MGSLVSASNLQRAAVCPASCALPRVGSVSDASARGEAVHDALAGDHEARMALCSSAGLPVPLQIEAEVAYAVNVDTGEVRRVGIGRSAYRGAKLTERDVPGTVDMVGLHPGDPSTVCVYDTKTGRSENVAPARDNLQLRHYAVAAARHIGADSALVALVYPRGDSAAADHHAMDALDLDMALVEMRDIVDGVRRARDDIAAGRQPKLVTGKHCTYCPAVLSCPAQLALVRAVAAGAEEALVNDELPSVQDLASRFIELTPEQRGRAWRRVRLLHGLVERARAALEAMAATEPIPLPGGGTLREVEETKEWVTDADAARRYLAEAFGEEVAARACKVTTSKTAIAEALKGLRGANTEALRALRAAGAVATVTKRTVKEVSQGEGQP